MDKLVLDLTKEGKDINEVTEMPFHYFIEILEERNKPKKVTSVMDLP